MTVRPDLEEPVDVVKDVSARLDAAGIRYMLTGSLALNYYTEPRMTRDVDFILELQGSSAKTVEQLFMPDYYVSVEAVREAIALHSSFNLIHVEWLIKVDCFVPKPSDFHGVKLGRRRQVTIADFTTWIVSREDLIVSKLDWARDSFSEQQLRDIRMLIADAYDHDYVATWVERLQLRQVWDRARAERAL